jgi:hypothetical protein
LVTTIEYLSDKSVQQALHVTPAHRNGNFGWSFCSDQVNNHWSLNDYFADTTHLYSVLFNHPNKPRGFKILVFSGDSDGVSHQMFDMSIDGLIDFVDAQVCATVGTQHWVYDIQNAVIKSLFEQWNYHDTNFGSQPGGFLTQFSDYFSFATVHYAGHEVPAYQPEKALHLFQSYLNGSIFFDTSPSQFDATTSNLSQSRPALNSLALAIAVCVFMSIVVCLLSIILKASKQVDELVGEVEYESNEI